MSLVILMFASVDVSAESDTGPIQGGVADGTGAAIPGAAVTLTSKDTGRVFPTTRTYPATSRAEDLAGVGEQSREQTAGLAREMYAHTRLADFADLEVHFKGAKGDDSVRRTCGHKLEFYGASYRQRSASVKQACMLLERRGLRRKKNSTKKYTCVHCHERKMRETFGMATRQCISGAAEGSRPSSSANTCLAHMDTLEFRRC